MRRVSRVFTGKPTLEGAGVHLKRGFGYNEVPMFDPFLMLDDFHSSDPSEYLPGFPWHPHRGIETVTYLLEGEVEHSDSMGNRGVIGPGDVQWMTAGGGIIHQEMPQANPKGTLWGFQLWVNLPASQKMMAPRYQEVAAASIPTIEVEGLVVKVIAGDVLGKVGPVQDIVTKPVFLDITLPVGGSFDLQVGTRDTLFIYVASGSVIADEKTQVGQEQVALFELGETHVHIAAGDKEARFLLLSGTPINEPIAWGGPIVMNTREEVQQALEEYRSGKFIKS